MSFQVPLSSSPVAPSTPGSGSKRNSLLGNSNFFGSNPSTTPAGPPPSSARSFTPAGPPPSSVFGSSQLGSGKTLFKSKTKAPSIPKSTLDSGKLARFLNQSNNFNLNDGEDSLIGGTLNLPDSSPPLHNYEDEDADEEEEDYDDEDEEEDREGYSEENGGQALYSGINSRTIAANPLAKDRTLSAFESRLSGKPSQSSVSAPTSPAVTSTTDGGTRGFQKSYGTKAPKNKSSIENGSQALVQREPKAPSIAQNLSRRLDAAHLEESDDFILGTEEHVGALYDVVSEGVEHPEAWVPALSTACERLCILWATCCDRDARKASWKDEVVMGIGPDEGAPSAHSATFLSTLLLFLYHPPAAKGGQALAISRFGRPSPSFAIQDPPNAPWKPTAYPKVLFDWLDKNHNPYQMVFSEVQNHKPNATAHEFYWDIVFKLVLRGRFAELIVLLKEADFQFARTAKEDGHKERGYGPTQVDNINMVINWALQTLQTCPALTDDSWHVPADSWILFRKRVEKAMERLMNFAEGRDKDLDPEEPSFEASNFGLKSTSRDLSRSSRRAESRVPWTILQNLKTLYGMLLGGNLEILSYSENWVEGTIALTALWNGDDDEEILGRSLILAKRPSKSSRSRGQRLVDTNPGLAYRRRLARAYAQVTEGPNGSEEAPLLPDTSKPLEVALSAIFEGDVEGSVGILRAMSLPISDAVAEIGTIGGWLPASTFDGVMDGFDDEDMDLLSFENSALSAQERRITRNTIMKEYAEGLFHKDELMGTRRLHIRGWELAIAVLARLGQGNNSTASQTEIRKILHRLPLDSDAQIDKILHICQEYDIPEEGQRIVEQYAGTVLDNSDAYGTALIYYARAHSSKKIKDILDLLISYSLVQSTAYPPQAALDPNLHSLIFAPKESLEHLALLDNEGAAILHRALAGYATVRKFYDLRDESVNLPDGQVPAQGPIARKKAAAAALIAIINSAADNICGGLYDESRESIVHVDSLLALLGEATAFINQNPSLLSLPQNLSLLKAIEDLSTVTNRIYTQCEDFFRSTLVAYGRSSTVPLASPRQMLKKQMSSITSGSSFSLVGSSLLDSQLMDAMEIDGSGNSGSRALTTLSKESEGEQEPVRRGWDWRKGLDETATGEDVLRILRLGLAREIARHWMSG